MWLQGSDHCQTLHLGAEYGQPVLRNLSKVFFFLTKIKKNQAVKLSVSNKFPGGNFFSGVQNSINMQANHCFNHKTS